MQTNAKQSRTREDIIRLLVVTVSSLIMAVNLKSFVQTGDLFPGGFTGITRLLQRSALEFWGVVIPFAPINLALNAVPAIISYKLVGKRFTLYSCLSIFFVSVITDMIPAMPITEDIRLISVFGGLVNGFAVSLLLQVRVTGGGTDFIALYVSNKTGKSIWNYVFMGNVCILVIFGHMFGWKYAGYSILFQFISTKMISTFHHRYDRVTLQITTEKAEEIMKKYVSQYHHGISCVEAIGGYSHKKMYLLHTVISSYEINDIVQLIQDVDEHVIINVFKTENFYGGFYRESLD